MLVDTLTPDTKNTIRSASIASSGQSVTAHCLWKQKCAICRPHGI